MARRIVSGIVGALIGAACLAFLQYVSSDLRWVFAVGGALTLAAGAWNGRRANGDLGDALLLSALPAAVFGALVVREIPALWPTCIFWVGAGCAGHAWRRPGARRLAAVGLVLAVVAAGALYVSVFVPRAVGRALTRESDEPAPEFALTTLAGAEIPRRDWSGKVVVLDFFATSCGPCLAELPRLAEVNEALRARSDVVLLVVGSESGGETLASLRSFAERSGHGLAFAWDAGGLARTACGVQGTPTLAVLDRSGRLRRLHVGYNAAETGFAADLLGFIHRLSAGG